MKKISLITLAVAAISASSAFAAPGDMYIGLTGGYQMTPGKTSLGAYTYTADKPSTTVAPKFDHLKGTPKGAFVSPSFGYMISDEFRSALSFKYNFNQKNSYNKTLLVEFDQLAVDNDFAFDLKYSKSWNVLANFYYDFLNTSPVTPFIGVGFGYGSRSIAVSKATLAGTASTPEQLKLFSATKKGFVASGTLGVAYKVNPNVSLELAYVVESLPKVSTKLPAIGQGIIPQAKAKNIAHNVGAGVRFAF